MSAETAEMEIETEPQATPETPTEPSADVAETPSEGGEQPAPEAAQADDVEISIGDSPTPKEEPAPEWVKDLRRKAREDARRIKELEARLSVTAPQAEAVPQLGVKPTLKDHDYDDEKFEAALDAWHEQRRKVEAAKATAEAKAQEERKAWQTKLNAYSEAKTKLGVSDYDDAEAVVQDTLSVTQQSIMLAGCDNPALVAYALGKAPAKAKELAAMTDPVKFAFALAKLESQIKMTKKSPPPAEKGITGTARATGTDSTLEKLRAEAERTGDYSKVVAHKRSQQSKGK
jgi:hypothetical protein